MKYYKVLPRFVKHKYKPIWIKVGIDKKEYNYLKHSRPKMCDVGKEG